MPESHFKKYIMPNVMYLLRAKYILCFMFLLELIAMLIYIQNSTANIIYQDQLWLIKVVDKYFCGSFSLRDLWGSHGGHRIPGYALIFLSNAVFFHLNTQLEIYLSSLILLITAIIVANAYSKSLSDIVGEKYIQVSFFLILSLLFSLSQWENIVFSQASGIFIKMLLFVVLFIILDKLLRETDKYFINKPVYLFAILFFLFSVETFGAAYSPAMISSSLIVILFKILVVDKDFSKRNVNLLFIVTLVSLFALSFYYYDIDKSANTISISKQLLAIAGHPADALKYFIFSLSASVFGYDLLKQNYLNQNYFLAFGLITLFIYFYSLRLFVLSRMFRVTYLPLFFITYSLTISLAILVGRFHFGILNGMASRYTTDVHYGMIGSIWIIFFNIFGSTKIFSAVPSERRCKLKLGEWRIDLKSVVSVAILIFIFSGYLFTNIVEWRISPYRKLNYEKMRSIALNVDKYNKDDLRIFQGNFNTDEVLQAIAIIKKYDLNVFHDSHEGSSKREGKSLVLVGYGPTDIKANQIFNKQPNGKSALWTVTENATPLTALVLNGVPLESSVRDDGKTVTALVPKELYEREGEFPLFLRDTKTGKKSNELVFKVAPKPATVGVKSEK